MGAGFSVALDCWLSTAAVRGPDCAAHSKSAFSEVEAIADRTANPVVSDPTDRPANFAARPTRHVAEAFDALTQGSVVKLLVDCRVDPTS
jgi:hypothetical protein